MLQTRYFSCQSVLGCTIALSLFALAGSAHARGFNLLLDFKGHDGGVPSTGLLRDSAGNLYGTTFLGGTKDDGVVFKLASDGTQTVLHDFTGGNDGLAPSSGLIADQQGNLYGTTLGGGAGCTPFGCGTVFKLSPDGTETILYAFKGGGDGRNPEGGLLADTQGNFYGTTYQGGANSQGAVFKLAPDGTETVLYSFKNGGDGTEPVAGLTADKHGNLYGTTFAGGVANNGTVFQLAPDGTETILFSFNIADPNGANPEGGLIADAKGDLYGTTANGAAAGSCLDGCGTVFKLAQDGTFTVLHRFTGGNDGANPTATLLEDSKGNFYGTAGYGGAGCGGYGCGTVFKLTPGGKETTLHAFTGLKDGATPGAGLITDGQGNLFGTASKGGKSCANYAQSGCGTAFQVKE